MLIVAALAAGVLAGEVWFRFRRARLLVDLVLVMRRQVEMEHGWHAGVVNAPGLRPRRRSPDHQLVTRPAPDETPRIVHDMP